MGENDFFDKYKRLIATMAKKYSSKGDFNDLMQAGWQGLLKAQTRFNPKMKVKLSTYAYWYIVNEMQKCKNVLHNPVSINHSQKYMLEKNGNYRITTELYEYCTQEIEAKEDDVMNDNLLDIIDRIKTELDKNDHIYHAIFQLYFLDNLSKSEIKDEIHISYKVLNVILLDIRSIIQEVR